MVRATVSLPLVPYPPRQEAREDLHLLGETLKAQAEDVVTRELGSR